MLDFYQFNSMLDDLKGLYQDERVPPPPPYELADYMTAISSNPTNINCGDARFSKSAHTPITDEDLAVALRPNPEQPQGPLQKMDVNVNRPGGPIGDIKVSGQKAWGNLGPELDDEGFKKYTGIRW
jgi:hypothetical protein